MTSIRRGARRAVSLSDDDLVQSGYLPGHEEGAPPLVLTPSSGRVDLPRWAETHRDELTEHLHRHGAVLFRGFGVDTADFAAAAEAAAAELYGDYGDLPRDEAGENIFSSTPYPADLPIHFHNESAHMAQWPTRIFFNCVTAAQSGGETPILDCRRLYRELDQELVGKFERLGLTYVRNFAEGIDVPWQDFFGTSDHAAVEARCAESGAHCEWLPGGNVRIKQPTAAVRQHPVTGEKVFFNQILLHHPAAVPESTRSALFELFAPEDLPRNVTYGNGSLIPDEVVEYLLAEYDQRAVRFPWQEGDMIMLDNMLVCHGRAPFEGPRKIIVAMSGIIAA